MWSRGDEIFIPDAFFHSATLFFVLGLLTAMDGNSTAGVQYLVAGSLNADAFSLRVPQHNDGVTCVRNEGEEAAESDCGPVLGDDQATRAASRKPARSGPILGPLALVHTTYAADIKLQTSEGRDGVLYLVGDEQPDLLYYDGTLYGDWSVFGPELLTQSLAPRVEQFDQQKALASSGPKVHA